MQINNRYYLTAVILLLATFALVFKVQTAGRPHFSSRDFTGFPLRVGNWQGKDLPLSEREYEVLGTDQVLMREYTDGSGRSIVLAIVYSANDRSSFHPPELCFLGGGLAILDKSLIPAPGSKDYNFKVNMLTMKDRYGLLKAWYWFAANDNFTHNYYLQQITILFDWLRYRTKQGALIRISARINSGDNSFDEARIESFIDKIIPLVEKFLKT